MKRVVTTPKNSGGARWAKIMPTDGGIQKKTSTHLRPRRAQMRGWVSYTQLEAPRGAFGGAHAKGGGDGVGLRRTWHSVSTGRVAAA